MRIIILAFLYRSISRVAGITTWNENASLLLLKFCTAFSLPNWNTGPVRIQTIRSDEIWTQTPVFWSHSYADSFISCHNCCWIYESENLKREYKATLAKAYYLYLTRDACLSLQGYTWEKKSLVIPYRVMSILIYLALEAQTAPHTQKLFKDCCSLPEQ